MSANGGIVTVAEAVTDEALRAMASLAGAPGLDPLYLAGPVLKRLGRVGVHLRRALPADAVRRVFRANVEALGRVRSRGEGAIGLALVLLVVLVAALLLYALGGQVGQALAAALHLPGN